MSLNSGSGLVADQTEIFRFLADPATHHIDEPVIRIDTHGAVVFLAGRDVYKVKRAVRFPFMDFSTIAKRRAACENEVIVNRDNAPELYLGAIPITHCDTGLRFGGDPIDAVEWTVHLRRFDENATLDKIAERGQLDLKTIRQLAHTMVSSHARAPNRNMTNAIGSLRRQIEETLASLAAVPELLGADAVADLGLKLDAAFARAAPLLREREALGFVRRCHGDLHLRNIALVSGKPILFDAIEFNDEFATCDVLYDLAFLLMDLWRRDLKPHANLLFNHYLWACDDEERQIKDLAIIPLFLCLRAAIRAKVSAALYGIEPKRQAELVEDARCHFRAARLFLEPAGLHLIAIGGLSGTGKTTLAQALAAQVGKAPGAVHLRSDIERKNLYKVTELEPLPAEAYRNETNAETYERLRHLSLLALQAGASVIVDALHRNTEERSALAEIGRKVNVPLTGFWLEAPIDVRIERVAKRENDASDANEAIVRQQAATETGVVEWQYLDASSGLAPLVREALAAIP